MGELEPSWGKTIAIWWLIAWRNVVGSLVIGVVIGAMFGVAAYFAGVPVAMMLLPIRVVAVVAAGIWTAVVIRMALRKKYRGFRIALVALD